MKTKSEKYINSNIPYILRNAHNKGSNFKAMMDYLYSRLLDTNKLDISINNIEEILIKKIKEAKKIFSKEALFQGSSSEVGREFKKLSLLNKYSFNQ